MKKMNRSSAVSFSFVSLASAAALLSSVALGALAGCTAPYDEAEEAAAEEVDSTSAAFTRSGNLAPGIGASAACEGSCIASASNDCSDFDKACKGNGPNPECGVTVGGNPIAQVHTCVTIPKPPPKESTTPPGNFVYAP